LKKKETIMSLRRIKEVIDKNDSFLILTHIDPDGDALGSQMALARALKKLGKAVYMMAETEPPPMYRFLPEASQIKTDFKGFKKEIDVVFVLDCTNLKRTGKLEKLINGRLVINIDHHPGQKQDMDIVLNDTTAASTSILIYKLIKLLKVEIDSKTALLLYLGIATDTGSFKYSNTNPQAHRIAASLVKLGARPDYVNKNLYESQSIKKLRLLGLCLNTIKLHSDGKVAVMTATKRMYRETNGGPEYTEDFVNFPRSIKGVSVAVFLREDPKKEIIKVSFRSKEKINVDRIARLFGGGGHPEASGCILKGSLGSCQKQVLKAVKKFLK
jgi:bifunctional oligoribonuclease and PAP phosphatase NrnA